VKSTPQRSAAAARRRRLRRAHALVAIPEGGGLILHNFVARTRLRCSAPAAAVVCALESWTALASVERRLAAAGEREPRGRVAELLAHGVVVAEATSVAARDEAWRRAWRWGPLAGAYHHSIRDPRFVPDDAVAGLLARRALRDPPTRALPAPAPGAHSLPAPRVSRGVLRHLARRESRREFSGAAVTRREVADVLFAGLGVRALWRHPVMGMLVFKLSPSPGARNAIDAYVHVLRVEGIAPGAYRYDGLARALEPLRTGALPAPRHLLGGQAWTDGAAFVVFLVATFSRASWKYRHPMAYRSVVLEAGHIAQNLLLAASDRGLAATPTAAITDTLVEATLRVAGPDRGVLHAVVVGSPARAQRRSRPRSAASSTTGG
jgi:SagB-type dehydrogenase family enzyme